MKYDLIIVGGGLAGAALAVALRRTSLRIALVEHVVPARQAGWDQRIYAYSPASVRFLEELGVWAHIDRTRLASVDEIQVFGDAGGSLRFSAHQSGLAELARIGESSLVHVELWEGLKRQHNVALFCPAHPRELIHQADGVALHLADGRVLNAAMVVGADGRDSWVRQKMGVAATVEPYHQKGVVANFSCGISPRGMAWQWFREDGVLAWLPLAQGGMSMVWSAKNALADELMALDEEAFCERVAQAGERRLGRLELLTPRAAFPLSLMRLAEVVGPRVALIGDAAHAIHPLSGHGINLGFQDARVLAEELAAVPSWQDPGDHAVLRRYARRRAEEAFVLQYATHGLNRLFGTDNPFIRVLRNAGLNLTARLPVVTNMLVRYAANERP